MFLRSFFWSKNPFPLVNMSWVMSNGAVQTCRQSSRTLKRDGGLLNFQEGNISRIPICIVCMFAYIWHVFAGRTPVLVFDICSICFIHPCFQKAPTKSWLWQSLWQSKLMSWYKRHQETISNLTHIKSMVTIFIYVLYIYILWFYNYI